MRRTRLRPLSAAALPFVLLTVPACGPAPAPTATTPAATASASPPAGPPPPVTTAIAAGDVASAMISGVIVGPITLKDGVYEGSSKGPTGEIDMLAVLLPSLVRLGELDTHPGAEAAALIASNGGPGAERITLAVVGRVDGRPVSLATATVGDRIRIRDVRVTGRDIQVDVVEGGPGDPACCGTQLATRTYRLDGTTLAQVSSEVTGRLSLASTVAGRSWTTLAIDGEPLPEGAAAPTLTFDEGRFSGSTGCNDYARPVTEPTPGTLTPGIATASRGACGGAAGALERRFLGSLAKVTGYTFLAGRLVLSGLDGEAMRNITLSRGE